MATPFFWFRLLAKNFFFRNIVIIILKRSGILCWSRITWFKFAESNFYIDFWQKTAKNGKKWQKMAKFFFQNIVMIIFKRSGILCWWRITWFKFAERRFYIDFWHKKWKNAKKWLFFSEKKKLRISSLMINFQYL